MNRFKYVHVKEICAVSQHSLKYKCENSFRYNAENLHIGPYWQVPGKRSQPKGQICSAFCQQTPKAAVTGCIPLMPSSAFKQVVYSCVFWTCGLLSFCLLFYISFSKLNFHFIPHFIPFLIVLFTTK